MSSLGTNQPMSSEELGYFCTRNKKHLKRMRWDSANITAQLGKIKSEKPEVMALL